MCSICGLLIFFFLVQAVKKVCLPSLHICFGLLFPRTALKGVERPVLTTRMVGSERWVAGASRHGCPGCVPGGQHLGLTDAGAHSTALSLQPALLSGPHNGGGMRRGRVGPGTVPPYNSPSLLPAEPDLGHSALAFWPFHLHQLPLLCVAAGLE